MTVAERRRQVDRLAARCHAGLSVPDLQQAVLQGLRQLMSIDAAFFATVDPATILFTSVLAETPLDAATPLFLENEFGREDVNKFAALAASRDPVCSLDHATRSDRSASDRYLEVMAPMQLGDELRAALVSGGRCWGVLCLHREDGRMGFEDREIAECAGSRHTLPRACGAPSWWAGWFIPGRSARPGHHLAERRHGSRLDKRRGRAVDGGVGGSRVDRHRPRRHARGGVRGCGGNRAHPQRCGRTAAVDPIAHARRQLAHTARSRLEAPSGGQNTVVFEAAHPADVASIYLDALGLTPAQTRIASLVLQVARRNRS